MKLYFLKTANERSLLWSGEKNVWSKSVDDNFHLVITACVAANGLLFPPFFSPGQLLNQDVMDGCTIEGIIISVA